MSDAPKPLTRRQRQILECAHVRVLRGVGEELPQEGPEAARDAEALAGGYSMRSTNRSPSSIRAYRPGMSSARRSKLATTHSS